MSPRWLKQLRDREYQITRLKSRAVGISADRHPQWRATLRDPRRLDFHPGETPWGRPNYLGRR